MKKRLIAFGLMLVLIMAMSMTAMAAGTITSEERAVLNHFEAVQSLYVGKAGISQATADYNIGKGEELFLALDFNSDQCKAADAIIDAWAAELAKTPNATKEDLQAKRQNLIDIATNYKSDYLTVTVADLYLGKGNAGKGYISVTLKTPGQGGGSDTPAQESQQTATIAIGQGIINQTGVDTTATVAVIGGVALISLLGVGAFIVSRSKKVAR